MTTISDIYAGLNPLPAMLSAKGKVKPVVDFRIEANAGVNITLKWQKFGSSRDWDNEYEWVSGPSFEECLTEATARIAAMPSAEQARLQEFMGKLGELIDAGKDNGIAVDYLNPLLDTMKRLSENVITYRPQPAE